MAPPLQLCVFCGSLFLTVYVVKQLFHIFRFCLFTLIYAGLRANVTHGEEIFLKIFPYTVIFCVILHLS